MEPKLEFDCTLGGSQSLPEKVNIVKYSAARCREIEMLKKSLKSNRSNKLIFQKLPKHMRRRVMSHNAKRLPRRLREIHLRQLIKSGMPQKRPSRKYRRRPKNLMIEFARRQNKHRWLETHIWHAKRFHMIEKWGYRLPDRPCDKSFRACYRATAKHCLIQDVSYISCVELKGDKGLIIDSFKRITRSNEGLSLGAKAFINGNREGVLNLYNNNKSIGKILFNWHGSDNILWIWIHAAYYKLVLNVLKGLDSRIHLTELKDELNRFRLTGPLSQSVLRQALKPVELLNNTSSWLKIFLENDERRQLFSEQIDCWNAINDVESPAVLSPRVILSLIVTDPRYMFPTKRTKAVVEDCVAVDTDVAFPRNVNTGAIWDAQIRVEVKANKLSNAAISDMRSKLLVPGSELKEPGQPVPIMLIQRPGKPQSGYCCGWDVIVPSGWAQSTWMCFIMWGARAGGLRETDSIDFEMGRNIQFAPDTEAGKQEEEEESQKYIEKYFRKPPNKRINYNKFNIISPFRFNWQTLINNWSKVKKASFSVLRNLKLISELQEAFKIKNRKKAINLDDDCLVSVKLVPEKGLFTKFAIVCMPSVKDIQNKSPPIEPISVDANQVKRKALRTSHKELLIRLKRKRRTARKEGKVIPLDVDKLKSYQKSMRELWIAPTVNDIRNSCSRQVMGFVTKGDFSYVMGNSCAVGYVAAGALKHFLAQPFGNRVLLRNMCSRQYRFASIEIIQ